MGPGFYGAGWFGKDVTLRFMDRKRDNGKDWYAIVISIVTPAGVDPEVRDEY